MQRTFNQVGEKAVLLSLSYDFSHLGISGLSTILNYVEGWDGRVLGIRQDARELDLTIDYKIPKEFGLYENLWLRLRPPGSTSRELPRTAPTSASSSATTSQ